MQPTKLPHSTWKHEFETLTLPFVFLGIVTFLVKWFHRKGEIMEIVGAHLRSVRTVSV
jgi:hypothetical protein